jgi:serine O-acetyltransferase
VNGRENGAGEEVTIPRMGFWRLVVSDCRAHHADREESGLRFALLLMPRLFYNPSLQLAFLVRVAQCGPSLVRHPVRWLQVALFSSEVYWFGKGEDSIRIGSGLNLPHPINVLIGAGATIGSNVSIYNNVSIGTDLAGLPHDVWQRAATVGDRAVIYPYATLMGPYGVGNDAVVGMHVMLHEDVPAGALKTVGRLRLRGEWDPLALAGKRPVPKG